MIRLIVSVVLIAFVAPAFAQSTNVTQPPAITVASLEIDGFQYLANQRRDASGSLFYQNGQLDEGILILLHAQFSRSALTVDQVVITDVVLADGSKLEPVGRLQPDNAFAFRLGSDASDIAIKAHLEAPGRTAAEVMKYSKLAGIITVVEANGTTQTVSGPIQDKRGSKENVLGMEISTAMRWGKGRYYAIKVEQPEHILSVTVLDEQGNEFPQIDPFETAGDNLLKIYVDKPENTPFKLRLTRPESISTYDVPFELENFNLLDH